jgi:hypothetical protein
MEVDMPCLLRLFPKGFFFVFSYDSILKCLYLIPQK